MKYKKGQIVKYTGDDFPKKRNLGKIICNKVYCIYDYCIEFFEHMNGHDCNGKGKDGYCWWVDEEDITLYYNKYKLQKLLCKKSVNNNK